MWTNQAVKPWWRQIYGVPPFLAMSGRPQPDDAAFVRAEVVAGRVVLVLGPVIGVMMWLAPLGTLGDAVFWTACACCHLLFKPRELRREILGLPIH